MSTRKWVANSRGRFCECKGTFIEHPLTTYKSPPVRAQELAPATPPPPDIDKLIAKLRPVTSQYHQARFTMSCVPDQMKKLVTDLTDALFRFQHNPNEVTDYERLANLMKDINGIKWLIEHTQEELLKLQSQNMYEAFTTQESKCT